MDLVVWSGPVAKFQVPGATVPGAAEHFFGCTGDGFQGSAKCHDLANSWLDGEGRRIPRMLAAAGVSEAEVDNLYLGAFSAGGSIVKRLLLHPADRAMVKAVMLADASYTAGPTAPHAIEGYVDYIVDLTTDPSKLFVSTSSASPNKSYGSASDTMRETMKAASARSGVPVDRRLVQLPLDDQPEQLERIGDNVVSADYGMKGGGHGYHPKMAPEVWQQILQSWLAGDQPTPPVTPPITPAFPMGASAAEVIGSFVIGGLVGYAAVVLVERLAN